MFKCTQIRDKRCKQKNKVYTGSCERETDRSKMSYLHLKSALRNIPDLCCRILGLNNLSTQEIDGQIGTFTKIKLIPYTSIWAPFSLGRTVRGVSFLDSYHKDPFALFVRHCSHGEPQDNLVNYLSSLYAEESRMNSSDIVGLPKNLILSRHPAWATVMPWETMTLDQKSRVYLKDFVENRVAYDAEFNESELSLVNNTFYSKSNAKSQVLQTKALSESIKLNGYSARKPLPGIFIMYDGRCWRWFMSDDGNHRAYLLNTHGYESFVAEIRGVVNRSHVTSWINVKNGTYSPAEALYLFDSFFNGDKQRRGVV